MSGKAIIPLVLGLCIGLIAVKFGVDAIKNARGAVPAQPTIEAVRAKLDIDAYQQITNEMVELVTTSDEMFAPRQDRIASLDQAIGRVTGKAIPAQSPVLRSMLTPEGTPPGMVGRIPPGFRAVSVRIDEVTGVAYQVHPGDFVDVIVVMDIVESGRRRRKETIAEVILQGIKVAAIGQETSGPTGEASGGKVKPARSATLLVAEEDVPKLHLAATRGKITLAMRGDADTVTKALGFVRDSDVFAALRQEPEPGGTDAKPKPVAAPQVTPPPPEPEPKPEPYSVLVRRGSTILGAGPSVQRVYFEHEGSTNIIGTSDGLAGRKAATLSPKRSQRPGPSARQQQDDLPDREEPEPDNEEPDYGE